MFTFVSQDSGLFLVLFVFRVGSVVLDESLEHISGLIHEDGVPFEDWSVGVQFIVITVLLTLRTDLDAFLDGTSTSLHRQLDLSIVTQFEWFV